MTPRLWHPILLIVFLCAALPAFAHRETTGQPAPPDALIIPGLSHGQMAVIAKNRTAILDLAARQIPTDPVMRRLEAFINLQFFACLWGLVPGSIDDEASPFNECSHAHLAATRMLLLHLQDMPGDRTAVRVLMATIENEMIANDASLVMCRFSEETFNTAERISPRWSEIPFHAPSLATFGALAGVIVGGAWLGLRPGRGRRLSPKMRAGPTQSP